MISVTDNGRRPVEKIVDSSSSCFGFTIVGRETGRLTDRHCTKGDGTEYPGWGEGSYGVKVVYGARLRKGGLNRVCGWVGGM